MGVGMGMRRVRGSRGNGSSGVGYGRLRNGAAHRAGVGWKLLYGNSCTRTSTCRLPLAHVLCDLR